ncbi:MAG: baseplate J/gp47 family protein [Candidatus Limnocylindrales bacterium]
MGIHYLDIEDEITTAVGRLRQDDGARVALVLPPGSRIATSRINFRLLAREAREHGRLLAIVTPETSVRAVAVSAGLPAYAAVSDYEAALAEGVVARPTETTAPPGAAAAGAVAGPPPTTAVAEALAAGGVEAALERTRPMPVAGVEPAVEAGPAVGGRSVTAAPTEGSLGARIAERLGLAGLPVVGGSARGIGGGSQAIRWATLLIGLAIVVAALGVAAFAILPSASITITPVGQVLGPVAMTVVADPSATAVDATTLVVPARTVTFQLSANDTFPATGVKVHETKASGTVTFSSDNTAFTTSIPAGSVVSTAANVAFRTVSAVTVPRANFKKGQPGIASVGVEALKAGTQGNVQAGTITQIPAGYRTDLLSVNNADDTTGGTHKVTPIVAQADYDDAVKALTDRLGTQLRDDLADPTQVPAGLTLFPTSAKMGKATADTAASKVVGSAAAEFPLTVAAPATASAVDLSQLAPLAEARLKTQVPAGYQLFADSITSQVGDGTVEGDTVSFPVQARAQVWKPVAQADLLDRVKGKTIAAARADLASLGQVAISVWPSWVSTIPTLDQRLSLTIAQPQRPTPSGSPGPAGTIAPSAAPAGSANPASGASPSATASQAP